MIVVTFTYHKIRHVNHFEVASGPFTGLRNHLFYPIPECFPHPPGGQSRPTSRPQPLAPPQATSCLWICLFWTLPRSGITRHVSICVWLPSLSAVTFEVHPGHGVSHLKPGPPCGRRTPRFSAHQPMAPHRGRHPHEFGLARNAALSSSARGSCFCSSADVRPGPLGPGQLSGLWHMLVPPLAHGGSLGHFP